MSNRNSRVAAANRAEARRRARHLAQGGLEGAAEETDAEADSPPSRGLGLGSGSFLTRLFPPAPPLPGKGDPLAGFHYTGRFRGLVSSLYLLSRHPLSWGAAGVAWGVARLLTDLGGNSVLGVVASLISFGSLIAAGWIGWQRPWVFGLAASILGLLIYAGILTSLLNGRPQVPYGGFELFFVFVYREAFQPLFGALAGWYGGYLRRRMAAAPARARSARRR
jgi:hypothetical protein